MNDVSRRGILRSSLKAALWLAAALSAQSAAAPLELAKSFSPDHICPNGTATLTLTLSNPDNSASPNIDLTDIYPAGMTNAAPATTTCDGTLEAPAGGGSITLTKAKLPGNASCTITVLVTADEGVYSNTATVRDNKGVTTRSNDAVLTAANPSLVFLKTVAVYADPVNGTASPKAIPGADVDYTVKVTNTGGCAVDGDSLAIVDPIPKNTTLFTGDMGLGAPFIFADGTPPSGLSCTFTSLSSTTDCVDFSTDGSTWTYTPSHPYDPAVTHIRFRPSGTLSGDATAAPPSPNFDLRFRVRIN